MAVSEGKGMTRPTHDKGGVNTVFQRWANTVWTLHEEAAWITFQAPKRRSREMIYMLQWCSATVAAIFLGFLGESVDQDGTVLQLQNVRLDVQPQCCGLNANLALLATAIVAAMLFLHRPVPRMILILA